MPDDEHGGGHAGELEGDGPLTTADEDEILNRRRSRLRARRAILERESFRRARSWSLVGALTLLGAGMQLLSLIIRRWRDGDGAAVIVFVILLLLALAGAGALFRRARRATRPLERHR